VKRNPDGEVRSEPRNKTGARFRSGRIGKIPRIMGNITLSRGKNQMKFARRRSLYHKEPPTCVLSDVSTGNHPSVNRPFGLSISVPFSALDIYWLVFQYRIFLKSIFM